MNRQQKAYAYAMGAVLLWSTVASAFKLSLRSMSPLQLLLWADVASIICLFIILAAQKKLHLVRGMDRRALLRSACLGVLNPFLYYVVLFAAYDLLPAQEAQPLNYTWAVTLTILSVPLLGHRVGLREWVAIFVSYLGVVVISTRGEVLSLSFSSGPGVALALGSTIIWALYWIFNAKDSVDPVAGLLMNFIFGFTWILGACLLFSSPAPGSLAGLGGAVYVGVFEMGAAFVFWLKALRLTKSAAKISTLIFFSPFLSLIFIHFLVGEDIRISTIIGLIFIVAGNVIQQTSKDK